MLSFQIVFIVTKRSPRRVENARLLLLELESIAIDNDADSFPSSAVETTRADRYSLRTRDGLSCSARC